MLLRPRLHRVFRVALVLHRANKQDLPFDERRRDHRLDCLALAAPAQLVHPRRGERVDRRGDGASAAEVLGAPSTSLKGCSCARARDRKQGAVGLGFRPIGRSWLRTLDRVLRRWPKTACELRAGLLARAPRRRRRASARRWPRAARRRTRPRRAVLDAGLAFSRALNGRAAAHACGGRSGRASRLDAVDVNHDLAARMAAARAEALAALRSSLRAELVVVDGGGELGGALGSSINAREALVVVPLGRPQWYFHAPSLTPRRAAARACFSVMRSGRTTTSWYC